jgi:hypothetical protein
MMPDDINKLAKFFEKMAQNQAVTQKEYRPQIDTIMDSVQQLTNDQKKLKKLLFHVLDRLDKMHPGWQG